MVFTYRSDTWVEFVTMNRPIVTMRTCKQCSGDVRHCGNGNATIGKFLGVTVDSTMDSTIVKVLGVTVDSLDGANLNLLMWIADLVIAQGIQGRGKIGSSYLFRIGHVRARTGNIAHKRRTPSHGLWVGCRTE